MEQNQTVKRIHPGNFIVIAVFLILDVIALLEGIYVSLGFAIVAAILLIVGLYALFHDILGFRSVG